MNEFFDIENMPCSPESEQAVLGCVLKDPGCMSEAVLHVSPEEFYIPQNREIFTTVYLMYTTGKTIDPLLVLDELVKKGVFSDSEGKNYLAELAGSVPSVANITKYADVVRDKFYLRRLITASKNTIEDAETMTEEVSAVLDAAEKRIYDIRSGRTSGNEPKLLKEVITNEVFVRLSTLQGDDKDLYKGIETGYNDLDNTISGFNKSDLILIGARPAMGKTSFALNLCRNIGVLAKKKVVFFSLEMSREQLAERLLSSEALVDSYKFRSGDLGDEEWKRISDAADNFLSANIYLDDTAGITVTEIKSRIRRMRGVDAVIIDYLGLLRSSEKKENRVQEVSGITRELKMMAKELNIPVIVCAQLNRGSVDGKVKVRRPQLTDLRESGSIEQDADIVMFLHREAYYNSGEEDMDESGQPADLGATDLIVAKNRHGETRTIKLHFDMSHTRFTAVDFIKE